MAADYGAHEVMELHEVLNATINGINQFQLYRPWVTCQQLSGIMERQLQFMVQEYNTLLQAVQGRGMSQAIPYRAPKTQGFSVQYGLRNPAPQMPNASSNEMDSHDIASGMLCHHKASAVQKMTAALEFADPELRRMMQQSAVNCTEQAYELWQYMNEKGYYQVPTMKDMTTQTMINAYSQIPAGAMSHVNNQGRAMPQNAPMPQESARITPQ